MDFQFSNFGSIKNFQSQTTILILIQQHTLLIFSVCVTFLKQDFFYNFVNILKLLCFNISASFNDSENFNKLSCLTSSNMVNIFCRDVFLNRQFLALFQQQFQIKTLIIWIFYSQVVI